MNRFSYFIIIFISSFFLANAQDITLDAPSTVIQGQQFRLRYKINSSNVSSFNPPAIDGCNLLYGPASSVSYSTVITNGRQVTTYEQTLTFTYEAVNPGTFTIPAVSVTIDGKRQTVDEKKIQILPPDKDIPSQSGSQSNHASTSASGKDIFIRVILNKKEVYEQQPVEMTVKLYSRSGEVQFTDKTPDSYEGFMIEEIPGSGQWEDIENYNGYNYYTSVLKKALLYPQKTGELTVGSGKYDAQVVEYEQQYIGYMQIMTRPIVKNITLAPASSKIKVLPLPNINPALESSFGGAVGNFKMKTELSDSLLRTGEAATLSVTISGSGNFKGMKEPKINFPPEFEVYPPKNESSYKVSGNNLKGEIKYEYVFVPLETGSYTLPKVEFTYFNPESKTYVTETSLSDTNVTVVKGSNVSSYGENSRQKVVMKNIDIKHIVKGDKGQSKEGQSLLTREFWYWLIYPLLIIILIGIIIATASHRKAMKNVVGRKMSKAYKTARKHLKKASMFMKQNKIDLMTEEISKALWGYISDKLSIPVSELNRSNIVEILSSSEVNENVIKQFIDAIDNCEIARYAGASAIISSQSLYDDASKALNSLESIKIK